MRNIQKFVVNLSKSSNNNICNEYNKVKKNSFAIVILLVVIVLIMEQIQCLIKIM